MSSAAAGVGSSPFPSSGFSIHPLTADDAPTLAGLGSIAGMHYLCFGSDAYRGSSRESSAPDAGETIAVVVAETRDGNIAGIARLAALPEGAGQAELTVAVQAAYERLGLVAPLLAAIVAEARGKGVSQLVTRVECHRCNPAEDLRDAGLRAVSWLGTGGVTELVLAIE